MRRILALGNSVYGLLDDGVIAWSFVVEPGVDYDGVETSASVVMDVATTMGAVNELYMALDYVVRGLDLALVDLGPNHTLEELMLTASDALDKTKGRMA
jgi:hypothetical protein